MQAKKDLQTLSANFYLIKKTLYLLSWKSFSSIFFFSEQSTHVNFLLFLFLLLLLLFLFGWSTASWGSLLGRSGVLESVLELVGLFEGVVSAEWDGSEVLEWVGKQVGHCGLGNVTWSQWNCSKVSNWLLESCSDISSGNIKDISRQNCSILIDFLDSHLVGEWSNLELF